jgi:hypothetical protein
MSNGDAPAPELRDVDSLFGLPGVTDETPAFSALRLTLDLSRLSWGDMLALQSLGTSPDETARLDQILDLVVEGGAAAVPAIYRVRVAAAIIQRASDLASPKFSAAPSTATSEATAMPSSPPPS